MESKSGFPQRNTVIGDGCNRVKMSVHTTGAFSIVHQYSGARVCLADASRLTDVRSSLSEMITAIDAYIAHAQEKDNG